MLQNIKEHLPLPIFPCTGFSFSLPPHNTENKYGLYELVNYFTVLSNTKAEMASSLGLPARKLHCSYSGWAEMEVLG